MRKIVITGAAVLATAGIGLGAAQLASADTTTPSPEPGISSSAGQDRPGLAQGTGQQAPDHDDRGPGRKGHPGKGGLDTKALAEKLGVEESALQEALKSLRPTEVSTPDEGTPPQKEDRATREANLAKGLTEKLGLDESTVSSALTELRETAEAERASRLKQTLDEAVAGGTLTQAEADAVQKAAESGIVEVRGAGGRP